MNTDNLMELANRWDESSGEGLNEAGRAALRICARQLRDELAAALAAQEAKPAGGEGVTVDKHSTNIALLRAGYYVPLPDRNEALDAAMIALAAALRAEQAVGDEQRAPGKVVAYRMFDREAVEAFRKRCPWIDGAPSQASLDALKDRYEFEFAYSGTARQSEPRQNFMGKGQTIAAQVLHAARQSEGVVLVPREPTEAMVSAMAECYDPTWGYPNASIGKEWAQKSYAAMLAAAPGGEGEG